MLQRRNVMPLPDPIREVLAAFRPLFNDRTWRKLMSLLTGTLLAHGRRTVAGDLRHNGNESETNFSTFHQVLNRARWSPLAVSRQLLTIIVETFVQAGGTLELVIDETLERRWGPKISKRGHYRDSALSSRKRSVSSPGLRWIVMAVVVTLPWTKHRWALPFLCVLATTPEVSANLGKPQKTGGEVGGEKGKAGPSLVPHAADQASGGYRLQHPGTGPAVPGTAGDPHHSLSSGCGPA